MLFRSCLPTPQALTRPGFSHNLTQTCSDLPKWLERTVTRWCPTHVAPGEGGRGPGASGSAGHKRSDVAAADLLKECHWWGRQELGAKHVVIAKRQGRNVELSSRFPVPHAITPRVPCRFIRIDARTGCVRSRHGCRRISWWPLQAELGSLPAGDKRPAETAEIEAE